MHDDVAQCGGPIDDGIMLRAILSRYEGSATEAICMLEPSGRIRRVTGAMAWAGAGADWASLWVDPEAHRAALRAVGAGRRHWLPRQRALHGADRWDLDLSPCRNGNGLLTAILVTCRAVPDADAPGRWVDAAEARHDVLIEAFGGVAWQASASGDTVTVLGSGSDNGASRQGDLASLCRSLVHPDDQETFLAHWTAGLETKRFAPVEIRVKRPDGDYRWMRARVAPHRDAEGSVREWIGTLVDIHGQKQAQDELADRNELLRLAVSVSGLGIWSNEPSTGRRYWSETLRGIMGVRLDIPVSTEFFNALIHPDDLERIYCDFAAFQADPSRDFRIEYRIRRHDTGEERHIQAWGNLVAGRRTGPTLFVGAVQDVTDTVRMRLALEQSERRLQEALRAGGIVAWEHDRTTGLVTRSENAQAILGIGSGHVSTFLERIHPDDLPPLLGVVCQQIETERRYCFRYRHPDGHQLWIETLGTNVGRIGAAHRDVGIHRDVTATREAEERLQWAAHHDALTGLRNRHAIQCRGDAVIEAATAKGWRGAMLLLDLDNFKDINDTLGHDAGDALLQTLAGHLLIAAGRGCDIARLGGDEFIVLFGQATDQSDVDAVMSRLREALAVPLIRHGQDLTIRTSGGIAWFPDDGRSFTELLKAADLALYAAKGAGRNRIETFTPAMRLAVEQRTQVHRELADGIDAGAVVPFYQPKVDLVSGRIVGFEALARWHHPEQGLLAPAAFSKAFDCPELGPRLSRTIRRRVIADMRAWMPLTRCGARIAINLCSMDFRDPGLADELLDDLAAAGVPPAALEVEITESVLLDEPSKHLPRTLARLHENGVTIALDDFGTGYASLTHLKRFPVDIIKIDRSFVGQLPTGSEDAAIVELVIGMAHTMKLHVVAEGIETAAQEAWLRLRGCHSGQGYYYAQPMEAFQVPACLQGLRN